MNRRIFHTRCLSVAIGLACLAAMPATATAAARSIESFLTLKKQWPTFAKSRTKFTLEGRVSSIGSALLRFRNCELNFRAAAGVKFIGRPRKSRVLEVAGYMTEQSGQTVFVVERMKARDSDETTVGKKRRLIDRDDPKEWYELADWVRRRGTFYKDPELLREARNIELKGLLAERGRIPKNDPDALIRFSVKVAEKKLSDALRGELVHEAYRLRWQAVRTGTAKQLRIFSGELNAALPGCLIAVRPAQPGRHQQYNDDSLKVYTAADETGRKLLHRMFYADVIHAAILKDAKPDGSNGFAVAELLDKELPELRTLAEDFRNRALAFRLKSLPDLNVDQVEDLSELFLKREQKQMAQKTKQQWLTLRETQLRKEGAPGLIRAAEHYERLLKDKDKVALLLTEAYPLNPKSERVAAWLKELGYLLHDDEWITKQERQQQPVSPVQRAMANGQVVEGMTQDQVRLSLFGPPNSVLRIATGGHVTEIWIYSDAGLGRLIRFQRRVQQKNAELKVVSQASVSGR